MPDYDLRRLMMVDTQVRPADVTKFPIIDALANVRREAFVPPARREAAYLGENLPIGGDRVLLEPRTFSKMLDALDLGPGELVLDIGCGLGYSAAVLARLAEAVVAVEDDADRVAEAEGILAAEGVLNVAVVEAPLTEGAPQHGPYDAITIQGGVERIPDTLTDQLKEGGRIAAICCEGALGVVRIGRRIDGAITWRDAFNAAAPVLPGFEQDRAFAL